MSVSLARICEVFIRLWGGFWLVRAAVSITQAMYLTSLTSDEIFRPARNMMAVDGATSLLAGLFLLVFARKIGRLIAGDGSFDTSLSTETLNQAAVRFVAGICLLAGVVFGTSYVASWWLQVSSRSIDAIWSEPVRARSGFVTSVVAIVIGAIVLLLSGRRRRARGAKE